MVAVAGMIGAFMLARGDRRGLALIEDTPAGAWRSFAAAFICLPAFLALRFLAWAEADVALADWERPVVAEALGFICAWTMFALASLPVAASWGQAGAWPRFLAAWNWSNVVQYALLLVAALLASLGIPGLGTALMAAALAYAVWIEWFVVRAALGVPPLRAAAIVLLDLAIGLFVGGFVNRVS